MKTPKKTVDLGPIKVVDIKDNDDDTCTIVFDVPDDFKENVVRELGWDEWSDDNFNKLVIEALEATLRRDGYIDEAEYTEKDIKVNKKTKKTVKKQPTKAAPKKVGSKKDTKNQLTSKLSRRLDELAGKVAVALSATEADCALVDIDDPDRIEDIAHSLADISSLLLDAADEMHAIKDKLQDLWP